MTDTPESIADQLRTNILLTKQLEAKKKKLIQKFQDLVDYGIAEDDGEPGRFSYKGLTISKVIRKTKNYHPEIEEVLNEASDLIKNAKAKAEEFDLYEVTESSSWRCMTNDD